MKTSNLILVEVSSWKILLIQMRRNKTQKVLKKNRKFSSEHNSQAYSNKSKILFMMMIPSSSSSMDVIRVTKVILTGDWNSYAVVYCVL
jgi:hypothetical protein